MKYCNIIAIQYIFPEVSYGMVHTIEQSSSSSPPPFRLSSYPPPSPPPPSSNSHTHSTHIPTKTIAQRPTPLSATSLATSLLQPLSLLIFGGNASAASRRVLLAPPVNNQMHHHVIQVTVVVLCPKQG